MTPQEQQMIDGLIQRVQNAPVAEKDFDAEQHLQQGLGRNPNALYVLAQTVLVQSYALEQAQKQLAETKQALAQAQQQQPKHATSFLGSIFGSNDDKPAPPPPSPAQQPYTPVPTYGQPQQYAPPQYQQGYGQAYAQPQQAPAGGGFLRGAMQTAAGVAAGALAFEGVESLMHGFGGHSGGFGGSGFGGFGGGEGAPREEIVNNYYGDSSPGEREHGGHGFADTSGSDIEDRTHETTSMDTSDQFDTGSDFADTSSDDFSSSGDSSFDDGSGSDDSSFS